MRILFDLRPAQLCKNRGIGNYINGLITHLLLLDKSIIPAFLLSKKLFEIDEHYLSLGQLFYDDELDYIDLGDGFDYFFVGGFFEYRIASSRNLFDLMPPSIVAKTKMISGVIYDFIPIIFKDQFLPDQRERTLYELHMEMVCNTDLLFAISEQTARDATSLLNIPSNRLHIVYGSINKNIYNVNQVKTNKKHNHVIYVAGPQLHKNINKAIDGFARAYRLGKIPKEARFLIICTLPDVIRNQHENHIKRYELTPGKEIELIGFVSEDKMLEYVSTSKASIFPSLYEGLGLPVLEGYAVNIPAYASNVSSLKEIVLPECSFDPTSIEEISQAFISIYNNEQRNLRSIEFGKNLLKEFTWERSAQKVSNALHAQMKNVKMTVKNNRIAVFSDLFHTNKEVTTVAAKTFDQSPEFFHYFSQIDNSEKLDYLKNSKYIFQHNSYAHASMFYHYCKNLFVLSDWHHSLFVLNEAIRLQHHVQDNYLFLYENDYSKLWDQYFNHDLQALKNFYSIMYPFCKNEISNIARHEDFKKLHLTGIYPIILMTGIKNIIVTHDRIRKIILDDIRGRIKDLIITTVHFESGVNLERNGMLDPLYY